jgi:hypothetical protein
LLGSELERERDHHADTARAVQRAKDDAERTEKIAVAEWKDKLEDAKKELSEAKARLFELRSGAAEPTVREVVKAAGKLPAGAAQTPSWEAKVASEITQMELIIESLNRENGRLSGAAKDARAAAKAANDRAAAAESVELSSLREELMAARRALALAESDAAQARNAAGLGASGAATAAEHAHAGATAAVASPLPTAAAAASAGVSDAIVSDPLSSPASADGKWHRRYLELAAKHSEMVTELQGKVQWYAENQALLDDYEARELSLRGTVDTLTKELSDWKNLALTGTGTGSAAAAAGAGSSKTHTLLRRAAAAHSAAAASSGVGAQAADKKRVRELERQVEALEAVVAQRHPNTAAAIVLANKPSAEESRAVLDLGSKLAEAEAARADVERQARLKLRSLAQENEKMRVAYERQLHKTAAAHAEELAELRALKPTARIKQLEAQLDSARASYAAKTLEQRDTITALTHELRAAQEQRAVLLTGTTPSATDNTSSAGGGALAASELEQARREIARLYDRLDAANAQLRSHAAAAAGAAADAGARVRPLSERSGTLTAADVAALRAEAAARKRARVAAAAAAGYTTDADAAAAAAAEDAHGGGGDDDGADGGDCEFVRVSELERHIAFVKQSLAEAHATERAADDARARERVTLATRGLREQLEAVRSQAGADGSLAAAREAEVRAELQRMGGQWELAVAESKRLHVANAELAQMLARAREEPSFARVSSLLEKVEVMEARHKQQLGAIELALGEHKQLAESERYAARQRLQAAKLASLGALAACRQRAELARDRLSVLAPSGGAEGPLAAADEQLCDIIAIAAGAGADADAAAADYDTLSFHHHNQQQQREQQQQHLREQWTPRAEHKSAPSADLHTALFGSAASPLPLSPLTAASMLPGTPTAAAGCHAAADTSRGRSRARTVTASEPESPQPPATADRADIGGAGGPVFGAHAYAMSPSTMQTLLSPAPAAAPAPAAVPVPVPVHPTVSQSVSELSTSFLNSSMGQHQQQQHHQQRRPNPFAALYTPGSPAGPVADARLAPAHQHQQQYHQQHPSGAGYVSASGFAPATPAPHPQQAQQQQPPQPQPSPYDSRTAFASPAPLTSGPAAAAVLRAAHAVNADVEALLSTRFSDRAGEDDARGGLASLPAESAGAGGRARGPSVASGAGRSSADARARSRSRGPAPVRGAGDDDDDESGYDGCGDDEDADAASAPVRSARADSGAGAARKPWRVAPAPRATPGATHSVGGAARSTSASRASAAARAAAGVSTLGKTVVSTRVGFGSSTARPAPSANNGISTSGLAMAVPAHAGARSPPARAVTATAAAPGSVGKLSRPATAVAGKGMRKSLDPTNILDIDPDAINNTDVDINFDAFFRS